MGCAESFCQFEFQITRVDRDDHPGPRDGAALNGIESDAAATEDHRYRARFHARGIDRRAHPRHDSAADQRGSIQGHLFVDLDQVVAVHGRELGHDAAAAEDVEWLPGGVARAHGTVRQGVQSLQRLNAQLRAAGLAIVTAAAHANEGADDMVPDCIAADPLADGGDRARPLVSKHQG